MGMISCMHIIEYLTEPSSNDTGFIFIQSLLFQSIFERLLIEGCNKDSLSHDVIKILIRSENEFFRRDDATIVEWNLLMKCLYCFDLMINYAVVERLNLDAREFIILVHQFVNSSLATTCYKIDYLITLVLQLTVKQFLDNIFTWIQKGH